MPDQFYIPDPKWQDFAKYLKRSNRYRLNSRWESFVQNIAETAQDRQVIIRKGRILSRARNGYFWPPRPIWPDRFSNLYPHPLRCSQMGSPPRNNSSEGRLNPKGISYLYLSNDDKTALAEVQPSVESLVTVGKFRIKEKQKIVDVTGSGDADSIWQSINYTFSKPASHYDDNLIYIPTQYLSELFKNAGFDGVKYRSSIRKDGFNVLLFNSKVAKCIRCQLYVINEICYSLRKLGNSETHHEQENMQYY